MKIDNIGFNEKWNICMQMILKKQNMYHFLCQRMCGKRVFVTFK